MSITCKLNAVMLQAGMHPIQTTRNKTKQNKTKQNIHRAMMMEVSQPVCCVGYTQRECRVGNHSDLRKRILVLLFRIGPCQLRTVNARRNGAAHDIVTGSRGSHGNEATEARCR
jgi:hypothetical protein